MFRLVTLTDSSKSIYGVTIYLEDIESNEFKCFLAKNRLINKQLERKSIPSLAFQGVHLGVETLVEIKKELAGSQC